MTNAEARQFAAEWIRNFNAKDVDAVLGHFAEDVDFTSPRAVAVAGTATLRSRPELARYWHEGVKAIRSIRFTLDYLINDETTRRLTIVYVSEIDGRKVRAAEIFEFNESRQVVRGEALYGAVLR